MIRFFQCYYDELELHPPSFSIIVMRSNCILCVILSIHGFVDIFRINWERIYRQKQCTINNQMQHTHIQTQHNIHNALAYTKMSLHFWFPIAFKFNRIHARKDVYEQKATRKQMTHNKQCKQHKRNDCKQAKRSTLQFIHRNTHTTIHASTKSVNVWVLPTISVEWRDFIADTQSYNEIHRKGTTAIPNASTEWNGMDTKNHSTGCMS